MSTSGGLPPTHGPASGASLIKDSRDAWRRGIVVWHASFGVLAVMTAVLTAGDEGVTPVRRAVALALICALCGWYATFGVRALRYETCRTRTGQYYVALAAPLIVAVFALSPAGGLMLFVLYPNIWAILPTRQAIAGTAVVVVTVSCLILLTGGPWIAALINGVVGMTVSVLFGLWITRIIEQSQQRAELIAELAATRTELAEASRETGALVERARVARDIHDTLAQGFASVLLQLEAVEAELGGSEEAARRHLAAAKRTTRANLAEARSLIGALNPPDLRASSLLEALQRLAARTSTELGVPVEFRVTGSPRELPANQEVVLFRTAQEALTNVGKHAGASAVDVGLSYQDSEVSLRVCDDGRGFADAASTSGFGLAGMRARVVEAGGSLAVDTAPGRGVRLCVSLPGRCS
jgi:signal transduction histidine kinase